jgi:hypothetical protein
MAEKSSTPDNSEDQELLELLGALNPSKPQTVDLDVIPPAEEPEQPVATESTPVQQPAVQSDIPNLEPTAPVPDIPEVEPPPIDKPPIIEPELTENPVMQLTHNAPPEPDLMTPTIQTQTQDQLGAKILLAKFGTTISKIISNHDKDRDQAENAITFFESKVRNAADTKGMTPYVEGWIHSLKLKAEINLNATHALDSITKLLAASKGNEIIVNVENAKPGDLNLEELLAQKEPEV